MLAHAVLSVYLIECEPTAPLHPFSHILFLLFQIIRSGTDVPVLLPDVNYITTTERNIIVPFLFAFIVYAATYADDFCSISIPLSRDFCGYITYDYMRYYATNSPCNQFFFHKLLLFYDYLFNTLSIIPRISLCFIPEWSERNLVALRSFRYILIDLIACKSKANR